MKKIISLILVSSLLICLCGCSVGSNIKQSTDENGNLIFSSDRGVDIRTENLPATVKYNETDIKLKSVEFYEGYSGKTYTYDLYTVIKLDVSNCSDEELHWLQEEDVEIRTYVTCESNGYDFDDLTNLRKILYPDTKEFVFVEMTPYSDENRKSFSNSEITICVDVTQEKTYVYKDTNLNCTNTLTYNTEIGETITNIDDISEPLNSQISLWFTEDAKAYSKALNYWQ